MNPFKWWRTIKRLLMADDAMQKVVCDEVLMEHGSRKERIQIYGDFIRAYKQWKKLKEDK